MRVDVWDTVFIRARRRDVHPFLGGVEAYPTWWPGLIVEPVADGVYRMRHAPRTRFASRHEITAHVLKERPDKGMVFSYRGDLSGKAEFFYLDEVDGVAVHYVLAAELDGRGWRGRLGDHRASVRRALNHLKDLLEQGRLPGTEPDPGLLAHQAQAAAELLPSGGTHRTDLIREQS